MKKILLVAVLLGAAFWPTSGIGQEAIGWVITPTISEEAGHHLRIAGGQFSIANEASTLTLVLEEMLADNSRCARDSGGQCKRRFVSLSGMDALAILNQAFNGNNEATDLVAFIFSYLRQRDQVPEGTPYVPPQPTPTS